MKYAQGRRGLWDKQHRIYGGIRRVLILREAGNGGGSGGDKEDGGRGRKGGT